MKEKMMDRILLVIDMQRKFIKNQETKKAKDEIINFINLLKEYSFKIISTKYINFERVFNLAGNKDQEIIKEIAANSDLIINKSFYSCIDQEFIHKISDLNNGELTKEIFICGISTETSVLAIATDLYQIGITPLIVKNCCASTRSAEHHESGLFSIEKLIGKNNILDFSKSKDKGFISSHIT